MEKKNIPIGVDDFKEIIKENYYFVDKSLLIQELLESSPKVTLLPRPRRFGKTLNMSMLRYFFDIRDGEENRELFHGLKIEESKYIDEQGKYPVINISFKDIKMKSWEECFYKTKLLMEKIYREYDFLRESLKENEKRNFDLILNKTGEKADFEESILNLCAYMEKYFNQKVIILLDEYDAPLTEAYLQGYYDEAIPFFRNLMSAAFKSNIHLKFGVITGIIQISKESIFSGLNNVDSVNILNNRFNYFGLGESEVLELLKYYQLEDNLSIVKKWYNGYLFGNEKVSNPWSILNYIKNKSIRAYWVNTSSNDLIIDILKRKDSNLFNDLEKLFRGESITKGISERITFKNNKNISTIWSLMFFSGYLTYQGIETSPYTEDLWYKLIIPNEEVKSFFRGVFLSYEDDFESDEYSLMMRNLDEGDIDSFKERFKNIFFSTLSYYDGDSNEKSYHLFVLAMTLVLFGKYEITSNRESGNGRYDIALTPRIKDHHGIIFEFKVAKSCDKLKEKSIEALNQISERCYETNMRNLGVKKIIKIGIAFCGKEIELSYQKD